MTQKSKNGNEVHEGRCGAKTRSGHPCKNPAGFRTPHPGTGRCYLHGGCSTGGTGPPGNKNALKTGEYETIWLDTLPEDERRLYHEVNTDKKAQLDEEIRLITIRERRMLQRIEALKEQEFIVVEEEDISGMERDKVTHLTKKRKLSVLSQIQAIEEALTRVQDKKARLLELKHKIEGEQGPPSDFEEYKKALISAAEEVWGDSDGETEDNSRDV